MRPRLKTALVIFSAGLNVAFLAAWLVCAAHERGSWSRGESRHGRCPLRRQIGADEAQWRSIEPQLAEFQEKTRALGRQIHALRMELLDLLAAPEAGREAMQAKQEEIIALQRKMLALVTEHLAAQKALLTPQQQEKLFDALRAQCECAEEQPYGGSGYSGGCRRR